MSQVKLRTQSPGTRTPASVKLSRAIRDAGLTQEQAGKLVGVEDRQVRRWLKARTTRADRLDLLVAVEQIIMGPTKCFGTGKPIARDTSGTTAPSSRASHEGQATPVISASEQVVSPGSVGSFPAELGGAHRKRKAA